MKRVHTGILGAALGTLLLLAGANQANSDYTRMSSDADLDGIIDSADNCALVANPGQQDTNSDGYGNACDPDLNNDGAVDFQDLGDLKAVFFQSGTLDADFDSNGTVNFLDLVVLKDFIFSPPGPSGLIPLINVSPAAVTFGSVFVGDEGGANFTLSNAGFTALNVTDISLGGDPAFSLFPPTSFTIAPGDPPRTVTVGFVPDAFQSYNGTITVQSDAGLNPQIALSVLGTGADPTPLPPPNLASVASVEFGSAPEDETVTEVVTITNTGGSALEITALSLNTSPYMVDLLVGNLPKSVAAGGSTTLLLGLTAPIGSAGTVLNDSLSITSNDPDTAIAAIALSGTAVDAVPVINIPVLAAQVTGSLIDAGNCNSIDGTVQFTNLSSSAEQFRVVLSDTAGNSISSATGTSPGGAGNETFAGVDVCALADGVIDVSVIITQAALDLPVFPGSPAVKNTSPLGAPLLDSVDPVATQAITEVCGTSRVSTTVRIAGGASVVSTSLDAATTAFCLDVPLRTNQQNVLIVSALDDLAAQPQPLASALPVTVVQVSIDDIVIAEVDAEPLTVEEIETLVDNGLIDLDDPSNFNVSVFTIVLSIGTEAPITVSAPVAVPTNGDPTGIIVGAPPGGSGCTSGCAAVIAVPTPDGGAIPGVIIIDGRIKTLKEFFQVSLAILNASPAFTLSDVEAQIALPAGLSAVAAGPGTEVDELNDIGQLDAVTLGSIGPGQTGNGQFIVRGEAIGEYSVDVDFDGFITGGDG